MDLSHVWVVRRFLKAEINKAQGHIPYNVANLQVLHMGTGCLYQTCSTSIQFFNVPLSKWTLQPLSMFFKVSNH